MKESDSNSRPNKELKASALRYDNEKNNAPVLVAKGRGKLAEKIIEIAKKENITITKNNALADILDGLDIYDEIPPELYKVVAKIFAFLHKLNEKASPPRPSGTPPFQGGEF